MIELRQDAEEEDESVPNWPTAFAVAVKAIAFVAMIAIFAQCESGRIW